MMNYIFKHISILFIWMELVKPMSPNKNILYYTDESIGDIASYIASKGYLPNEKELPRTQLIKNNDNDATYLLSKLSDEELLKLLNKHPQKDEYDLNDVIRIVFDKTPGREKDLHVFNQHKKNQDQKILLQSSIEKTKFPSIRNNGPHALFRLNHRTVDQKGQNDPSYIALQKLKKLLNVYSQPKIEDSNDSDDKKKLVFDILVDHLKTLCCKSSKKPTLPFSLKQQKNIGSHIPKSIDLDNKYNEFMFLIINDEIKSKGSDELIEVDPESLDRNSSVLLLGPITSQLTDDQLKLVMNRISNELTKPEYTFLLQQLANGELNEGDKSFVKDFVFGYKTRRYIKPHRCNHQSKLAKVYGGPKWIVCTGYFNINKPSLYD